MNIPDTIFDEALVRLRKGESLSQIAADYADYQQELVSLLSVAQMGMSVPKLVPPTPYKAYKFANVTASPFTRIFEMLSFFRLAAVPISLVLALLGGSAIVSATANSLPGDKLYSLKRASENVQLTLTQDQDKVANLHVELMQKRLDEVKKAADTGNAESETLAIAELKSQTEKTFAQAGPIATANAISNKDSSLLDNLVAVNKEQKTVLTELSQGEDSEDTKSLAYNALADSKKNDQTLAKIIATVNDQTLADSPNKISVTGNVTLTSVNRIIIEKNAFNINDKTVITNSDGTAVTDNKLITGRATVIGMHMTDGTLLAKQITLLPTDGTVKGDIITKPIIITEPKEPPVVDPNPPVDQTKVQGSFIIEPTDSNLAP